jgi:hypothetical protein
LIFHIPIQISERDFFIEQQCEIIPVSAETNAGSIVELTQTPQGCGE